MGAIAGLIAGLAGAAVMEAFQTVWSKVRDAIADEATADPSQGRPEKLEAVARKGGAAKDDPATVKVAAAANTVAGGRLRKIDKEPAGRIVHYMFGAGNAVAYGALADMIPAVTAGSGAIFGVAVWIYADNLLLWAVGLAKRPTAYPASTHAYALASHVVYGLAVEAVRRLIKRALAT